jgi:hypothetical protein
LQRVLIALALVAPCAAISASAALPSPNWPAPASRGEPLLRATALLLHNAVRRDFGTAPMAWNEGLAVAARGYAQQMAATNTYQHDQTPGRRKLMGENIWRGPRGVFSYDVMLRLMIDERALFRRGIFPDVSTTGNFHDVAHYTQIVWPTTTEVGCGLVSNETTDYFVCRYAPTGNKDGITLDPTLRLAERG